MKCGACKYLGEAVTRYDRETSGTVPTGFYICGLIKQQSFGGRVSGVDAYVIDGSDYYAALCVKDEFGCNKWEPK